MKNIYSETNYDLRMLSLDDCVLYYQKTRSSTFFNAIMYKLHSTIEYYVYTKSLYEDKFSLTGQLEDKIIECLETYDAFRNSSFKSYCCACFDNLLYNLKRDLFRRHTISMDLKLSSDETNSSIEDLLGTDDKELVDSDAYILLESIKQSLDVNEYRVCEILLSDSHTLSKAEIAREMGVTTMAVCNIFNRLKKKFTYNTVCKIIV